VQNVPAMRHDLLILIHHLITQKRGSQHKAVRYMCLHYQLNRSQRSASLSDGDRCERLRPTVGFLFPLSGVLGLRSGVYRLWN